MAGNHDRNPLDKEEEVNPFSSPTHYSHSRLPALIPEPASYNHDRNPDIDIPLDRATKEIELKAKEAEIRREEEVKRKEEALARGLVLCLFWNILAVSAASIKGKGINILFLAFIYFMLGVPGAYILWYRPLYRACRKDSAFKFGWFFIYYMIHICFYHYAMVAPPIIYHWLSLTTGVDGVNPKRGVLSAVYLIADGYALIGILYFIGLGLFFVESLLSIWVLERAYRYFRGTGKAAKAKCSGAGGTAMAAIS